MKIASLLKKVSKSTLSAFVVVVARGLAIPLPQATAANIVIHLVKMGLDYIADSEKTSYTKKECEDHKASIEAKGVKKN